MTADDDRMEFAIRVRTARLEACMSQQELADRLGIEVAAVAALEAGRLKLSPPQWSIRRENRARPLALSNFSRPGERGRPSSPPGSGSHARRLAPFPAPADTRSDRGNGGLHRADGCDALSRPARLKCQVR
jgi:DNA-binding XRE family transcriptional regulator